MDSQKEKTKAKKTNDETLAITNESEEKKLSWQLIFFMSAFAIGIVLLILKIAGIL